MQSTPLPAVYRNEIRSPTTGLTPKAYNFSVFFRRTHKNYDIKGTNVRVLEKMQEYGIPDIFSNSNQSLVDEMFYRLVKLSVTPVKNKSWFWRTWFCGSCVDQRFHTIDPETYPSSALNSAVNNNQPKSRRWRVSCLIVSS